MQISIFVYVKVLIHATCDAACILRKKRKRIGDEMQRGMLIPQAGVRICGLISWIRRIVEGGHI
jgi:hypothetical protein